MSDAHVLNCSHSPLRGVSESQGLAAGRLPSIETLNPLVINPLVMTNIAIKTTLKTGKSTISMSIFNSYVGLPEGIFPRRDNLRETPIIAGKKTGFL